MGAPPQSEELDMAKIQETITEAQKTIDEAVKASTETMPQQVTPKQFEDEYSTSVSENMNEQQPPVQEEESPAAPVAEAQQDAAKEENSTKMVEEIRKKYGLYDDSSSSFHFDTTEESEQNQQPEAAAQVLQMQAAPPVIEEEKPAAEASEKMNIDIPVSPDLNEGSQEDEVMIFQNHIEIQPEPQAAVEEEEAIETAMQAPQVSSPKEKKLSLVSALKKEIQ